MTTARIALSLIDDWVIDELDGWAIKERYNDLKLGDKND